LTTTACGQTNEPIETPEEILSVQGVAVSAQQTTNAIEVTGSIKPIRSVSLNSPSNDIVGDIYVDIGEEVIQGELLASLVGEVMLQNIENARTALINARQNSLLSAISGNLNVQQSEADLRKAQLAVDLARESFEKTTASAEANIKSSEESLVRARLDSEIQIDRATTDLVNARKSTTQQRAEIEENVIQVARASVSALESQLEYAESILGVRESEANHSIRSYLGVRDTVNRDNAYAYFRDADRKFRLAQQSFVNKSPEEYFGDIMSSAYAHKLLMDTLSNVLRDTVINVELPLSMLSGMKAENDRIQSEVNNMIQGLEKINQSYQATLISIDSQLNNAEANLRQAKQRENEADYSASIKIAEAQLTSTRAQSEQQIQSAKQNFENAQIDLEKVQRNIDLARRARDAQVLGAKSQEDLQAGQLAISLVQRDELEIKAPFDGIVTAKLAEAGERIGAGKAIVEVSDMSAMKVVFYIQPEDSFQLALNQHVTVGDTLGYISKIAPAVDTDARKILVEALLTDSTNFISGTFAPVKIALSSTSPLIAIPLKSLYISESEKYVYIINGGIIEKRVVELGKLRGDIVEITSGLNSGDMVITSRNEKIQEGIKAEITLTPSDVTPPANSEPALES
jgi:multidrug efflux pump subunit AcrA (membrane-fusion protein)